MTGCFSALATKKLLKRLDAFQPDVIHLHNLHGWFVRLPSLFAYIKERNIPVVWTLHDCWALTGQCPHFTAVSCGKWKTGCHHCPQYREYPQSYVDRSRTMWKKKKAWFSGVERMTVVTPSRWLAGLVKESYLKDYPVQVIHNGIDLSVFRPTPGTFRIDHGCEDKFLLLGVSYAWNQKKGLDVFAELARRLGAEYQIVLVGTDEATEKQLPGNIISVRRTQSQRELAELYTAADLFVNPTREEVLGLVNVEALACGTPVITFRTGGSPEIPDETCGSVVNCGDLDAMEREIRRIREERPYPGAACRKRAEAFDMRQRFEEYVRLYECVEAGAQEQV